MEPLKFDVDGPTQTRATIAFKNWGDEHGLVIRKEKLLQDAKNFRQIAQLLKNGSSSRDQEYVALSTWLTGLSDKFQNAACGYDPKVEPKSYDEKPNEEKTCQPEASGQPA